MGTVLIAEGLTLMGIGMLIVFSFLLLLVVLLRAMSALAARFAPAETPAVISPAPELDNYELIVVISAAIARYRAGQCHRLSSHCQ